MKKNAEDFVLNLNDFDNVELYIGEAQGYHSRAERQNQGRNQ